MKFLNLISIFFVFAFISCAIIVDQDAVDYSKLPKEKKYKYDVIEFVLQEKINCNTKECKSSFVVDERVLDKEELKQRASIDQILNKGVKNPSKLKVYVDVGTQIDDQNMIWAFMTGLSLFLIPYKGTAQKTLDAVVLKDQKIVATYSFKADIDIWMHLLLLPAIPFQMNKEKKVITTMLDKVMENLVDEGIL